VGREDEELKAVFDWLYWQALKDTRLSLAFHVANERKTSWYNGKSLKQKGVKPGVPDIFIPIPNKTSHGLFIEMKIKPNKLTAHQVFFCSGLKEVGYAVFVAWSADEAINIIKEYLCYSD
jgi:hypothetical protein